ncbi:glycerol acyltransferase [Niabella ginsenosidivorans]|uniref:Glycerol acyltransferase n=1 Tax=Niabella ginsenosidivorans TaxID=1176587 RepID=A0A1A9HZI6_9BACT|nr:lysophospholipid acyltransferase family protein [Niabella ginsenosidivorans]ANH79842.1 glycerol acyltransferase [Niabella ginsenosidivorans]
MNIFKEIAGRVCAAWALITFIITFILILPFALISYLFKEPASTAYFTKVSKIWMRVWMFLIGCPLRICGTGNFEKGKSYIVTCNHNSLLDISLSSAFIPGPNKTIAKNSFAKIPVFGWYYSKGSVLVDRKSEKSRKQSIEKMKAVLKAGMHMCIYPEGTRNRTGELLKPFYNGAFKLAADTGHAIIPGVIIGTKTAVPLSKPFFFLPRRLEIHFLEPVAVGNKTAGVLKEEVFHIMQDYLLQHQ